MKNFWGSVFIVSHKHNYVCLQIKNQLKLACHTRSRSRTDASLQIIRFSVISVKSESDV